MLFNPCTAVDFVPDFELEENQLEVVEEMKLLGVIVRSDLKWWSNTEYMVKKANSRLWTMRRLKNLGASEDDLLDVYTKQICSVLELAVPVWQSDRICSKSNDNDHIICVRAPCVRMDQG